MLLFDLKDSDSLGTVRSVDTSSAIVNVENLELLRKLQVNKLVALQSSKPGQLLIGVVQRITRSLSPGEEAESVDGEADDAAIPEVNSVRVALIGTLIRQLGKQSNVFRRTLETVPEIAANCFAMEGTALTEFMQVISNSGKADTQSLSLGHYTIDDEAEAFLDGNRLFQRHVLVVGSTGSGKSWTTARLLEQVAGLTNANALVFDVHGEYHTLKGNGIRHFRVAGPGDTDQGADSGVLYLPYWLLSYEDILSMLLDRSDLNAPNQAMVFSRSVVSAKMRFLEKNNLTDVQKGFTIDSPVPYSLDEVLDELRELNTEMVQGKTTLKAGDYNGKLSRFIARLENKVTDRRLGFLFRAPATTMDYEWLPKFAKALMAGTAAQDDGRGGVKIVDFSEVPSDVLPIIVSLVANLAFHIQQWTKKPDRHPIALFCDEAHLYIPDSAEATGASDRSIRIFGRIAKEGRKYGLGLVVISQRPSEVDRTVLSQCNNVIAMRLTNAEDQSVVRRLLPDSLGGFGDLLPILDVGEALVVGDASLLPSRIRITTPSPVPDSGTIPFWTAWSKGQYGETVATAVEAWRKQSMS